MRAFAHRCAYSCICIVVLIALSVSWASAARLVELRAAKHAEFTRVVAELDERAEYQIFKPTGKEFILNLVDTVQSASMATPEPSAFVANIQTEPQPSGDLWVYLRVSAPLESETFTLNDPYRVVVNLKPIPPGQTIDGNQPPKQPESTEPPRTQQIQEEQEPSQPETPQEPDSEKGQQPTALVPAGTEAHNSPSTDDTQHIPPGDNTQTSRSQRGLVLVLLILNALLIATVIQLLRQNRRLRAQMPGMAESPRKARQNGDELLDKSGKRGQVHKPILERLVGKRGSYWVRCHYQDAIFFAALLVILIFIALSL